MKVLSIDYDYFQSVSVETLKTCYPDGVDLPTSITLLTWASHYANPYTSEKLNQVQLNKDELNYMHRILFSQKADIPLMITNSHKHIYNFIHQHYEQSNDDELYVCNVDMHHDMFNNNRQLDCGNWIKHLMRDYGDDKVTLKWIANPISLKVFGLDTMKGTDYTADDLKKLIPTSLLEIAKDKFDLIFLCRSDTWSPPHLDSGFDKLIETCIHHFDEVAIETDVKNPRNITPYVEELKPLYKKNSQLKH